ncbi:hypothetical protein LTR66_008665, partial [Elasticomyces elasticus]
MSYPYQNQGASYGVPVYDNEPPRQNMSRPMRGGMQAYGPAQSSHPQDRQRLRLPIRINPQTPQGSYYQAGAAVQGRQGHASTQGSGAAYQQYENAQRASTPGHSSPWPPRDDGAFGTRAINPPNIRPIDRGPPPQRPPRPNDVPPLLDPNGQGVRDPRLVQTNPRYQPALPSGPFQHQHRPQNQGFWPDDGYASPSSSPPPNVSRDSNTFTQTSGSSANKSTPDLPAHRPAYAAPRRLVYLGPPPSARRGPSSYYAQNAHVTPIAEETDSQRGAHDSKGSYASSNAIPIGMSDYYLEGDGEATDSDEDEDDDDDDEDEDEEEQESEVDGEEEQQSEAEERVAQPDLVRQASVGQRSKPTLTTIKPGDSPRTERFRLQPLLGGARTPKSGSDTAFQGADSPRFDRGGAEHPSPQVPDHHDPHGLVGVPAVAVTSPIRSTHEKEAVDGAPAQYPDNGFLSSGTGLLDPSSESDRSLREETSKEMLSPPPQQTPQARSPLAPAGLRIQKVSGGLEKDAGLSSIAAERFRGPDTERKGRLASRVGAKRPARLDVDAVRDAEARGSLTSLPDLIKRATRLASNLDRGQTASRPGTNRFEGCTGNEKHRSVQSSENRYSGSISDILASFPPPGFASNNASRKSIKQWPGGGLARAALPSDSDVGEAHRQRRRCCGMPLWAFCLLLLALILLVAAAVIVPVTLIVIPRQQQNDSGGRASASIASCQQSLACQNGGANVVAPDGACRCLCVNGFTG